MVQKQQKAFVGYENVFKGDTKLSFWGKVTVALELALEKITVKTQWKIKM